VKKVLPLFVFIDAFGWEILRDDPFAATIAPLRRRLESVLGYSSACVPSILSGRWPASHGNWSYFVYDPEHSPFRPWRPLRFLPTALTSRRFFRRWLSRWVKARLNFQGYFDLYNLPFKDIALYDFTEKRSPLRAGGLNRGPNIFDFLEERGIPCHVSHPNKSEEQNTESLAAAIAGERIDFAFVYWPDLDGLLHRVGNQSSEVPRQLRGYERTIEQLLRVARAHYHEIRLYIFGDHGMANCDQLLDLQAFLRPLPAQPGRDYAAVFDSTMARFWFFSQDARTLISDALRQVPQGRILAEEELERLGCLFPNRRFGQLIFLVREGVLIVPSDMGQRPLRAMHGYHPCEKHSFAALLTNQPALPEDLTAIPHLYRLMVRDAELAHTTNASRSPKVAEREQGFGSPALSAPP
jgi:hypothetical protein